MKWVEKKRKEKGRKGNRKVIRTVVQIRLNIPRRKGKKRELKGRKLNKKGRNWRKREQKGGKGNKREEKKGKEGMEENGREKG